MLRQLPPIRRAMILAALMPAAPLVEAQDRIADTVHNLSAGGPGQIRAAEDRQICVFCHAPHNNSGTRPLWNREVPVSNYEIYRSSTLDARPGQPTGASKLCLSCHDGTIALGSVLSRADRIRMIGGDFLPAGLSNLGTDLSDDHPISFHYTSGLAAADRQLAGPQALPDRFRLDASGELQCTTCHDPHKNLHGDFLVETDRFGLICTACHVMDGWSISSHKLASNAMPRSGGFDWPYATVGENACRSCHRAHAAGGRDRLLIFEEEEANCLSCHDGQSSATNIRGELDKIISHDPRRYLHAHDPIENLSGTRAHVECTDCHNGHAVTAVVSREGYVPLGPTLNKVRGVTVGGSSIAEAQYEYEVCFRCHGDAAVGMTQRVTRQSQTNNLRLRFDPGASSFHPVVRSNAGMDVVSLIPSLPTGSLIRCTDCHNNDAGPGAGGGGPDGPHGSVYDFLLERNYNVRDNTTESDFEYAMCYKCHRRTSILGDQSFAHHRSHIVGENTPCSVCHDPHGISSAVVGGGDHTHLINFDIAVVRPELNTGRLEFRDLGSLAGSCTLVCHGREHRDETYGD